MTDRRYDEQEVETIFRTASTSGFARVADAVRPQVGLTLAQLLPFEAFADTASLNALPRVGLVIGNSAYRGVPELRNPANDANAIAASQLRRDPRGFIVRGQ